MSKRSLHHQWKKLGLASLIGLITAWLICGLLAAYTLRQNNLTMLDLREAVFTADTENKDINEHLSALQDYVTSHMNTQLPKLGDNKAIQLKTTYERLVAAEDARVSAARSQITQEATKYCESTMPSGLLTSRVPCVQAYVEARPVAPKAIAKELYSYDFVSPMWSPDLAGWLTLAFAILTILLVIRIVSGIFIRRSLKNE